MSLAVFAIIVAIAVVASVVTYTRLVATYDPDGREERARRLARATAQETRDVARKNLVKRITEFVLRVRPMARDKQLAFASTLKRAGIRMTAATYYALLVACVIAGAAVGVLAGLTFASGPAIMKTLLGAVLGGAIGYAAPRLYVSRRAKKRRENIEANLPGTLEQLSIIVGAGQTIERGIKTIATRTHGPLADEFAQVDSDITYFGRTPAEALGAMAERCDIPTVNLFSASVSQSLAVGSPIAQVLKSQAKIATDNYYMAVEERSNKIRTKMIFPTVLFILPPIFIVSLGPTVLRLLEELPKITGTG